MRLLAAATAAWDTNDVVSNRPVGCFPLRPYCAREVFRMFKGDLYCLFRVGRQLQASASGPLAQIQMLTAGSSPPPSVMRKMESELGIRPLASYGLTEVILRASARTHAYNVPQWVLGTSPQSSSSRRELSRTWHAWKVMVTSPFTREFYRT